MGTKFKCALLPLAIAASLSGTVHGGELLDVESYLPKNTKILYSQEKQIGEQRYLFVKYLNPQTQEPEEVVVNAKGIPIDVSRIPRIKQSILASDLVARLAVDDIAPIKVNIALKSPVIDIKSKPSYGGANIYEGHVVVSKNGQLTDEKSLQMDLKLESELLHKADLERRSKLSEIGKELIKRNAWSKDKKLNEQLEQGLSTLTLILTKNEIDKLVKTSVDLIDGIELYTEPKDGIVGAMLDTRVDPHALNYSARRGNGVGIYMTESGCANAGHITNYTRLSGPRTDHAENVSAILRAVSPDSYVYCRGGAVLPSASDLNGSGGNPQVHIVTRSNGSSGSNSYSISDRDWDNLVYNNQVLTFLLAGNNGNSDDEIWSPGKGLNMVTVGSYDDSIDTISDFSSAQNPQTKNQKPEISAPGVDITAGGHTMSGTSMATPHAAAFGADLLSAYTWLQLKPAYAKAFMMKGATKTIAGGANAVGVGGLDFYDAYYNGTSTWWEGGNSSFDFFDDNDSVPNSGYIEREVFLNSSYNNVRIVFAWLNRGDYTYNNRTNVNPIGMDMDISVYDPNGNYVAGSWSYNNPYEMVNFNPSMSGTYVVKIKRWANRDTSSKFHAGLGINW